MERQTSVFRCKMRSIQRETSKSPQTFLESQGCFAEEAAPQLNGLARRMKSGCRLGAGRALHSEPRKWAV